MKGFHIVLVFLFSIAAEFAVPLVPSPLELVEEAEETVHFTARRSVSRRAGRTPVSSVTRAGAVNAVPRPPSVRVAPHAHLTRGGPVRKIPPPAPESASALEDH
jgi:hypothetical protein